eukprot:gene6138-4418_t
MLDTSCGVVPRWSNARTLPNEVLASNSIAFSFSPFPHRATLLKAFFKSFASIDCSAIEMSSDPQEAAQALLQNAQFLQMFEKVMGDSGSDKDKEFFKSMPKEGDPKRDEWLKELQERLHKETISQATKELEQVHTDSNGQWMYVLPQPGFCIKCKAAGGSKIFINIAQHDRIAEPTPMDAGRNEAGEEETRFRVPLSCGQARPDKDKSGKPCKVYDVIVNTGTMKRCSEDHEFRRFVAALCMQWIQQKYEPTMNIDEFGNLNFKAKGKLEPQRIRLSSTPKATNAMGDEIKLPTAPNAGSAPSQVGGTSGTGKLIEELELTDRSTLPNGEKKVVLASEATAAAVPDGAAGNSPAVLEVTKEGSYDWSKHAKPTLNPLFREPVPALYHVKLYIPTVHTIKEVNVRMTPKRIECYYVDEEADTTEPFLSVVFDYPVSDELESAKFIRKKYLLKLSVRVELPDETQEPRTKPSRDAVEEEEEEKRKAEAERQKRFEEERLKAERIKKAEEDVMNERKSFVENLSALQAGDIPPAIKEDVDAMPKDQLPIMLQRLENGIRKNDSLDVMLEKLPSEVITCICDYIREKLSLEPKRKSKQVRFNDAVDATAVKKKETKPDEESDDTRTYNYAKRAEKLFGIELRNRYVFALDS